MDVDSPTREHATAFQAVYPQPFFDVMRQLPLDFERSVFVDLGCGKGPHILLAAGYPFREIIGVEFSPALHRIASDNLSRYRGPRRCQRITLHCGDAIDFEIPSEPGVVFMYNPFDAKVMAHVAANVDRSLREYPRQLFVVYFNPKVQEPWNLVPTLVPLAVWQPVWPGLRGQVVAVWISKPSPLEGAATDNPPVPHED